MTLKPGCRCVFLDFLKSLDRIVDTAIDEKVDLVIFAGDAYKDRSPAPTFQREWGRRIIRLSNAGVPIDPLVGNHDLSPAAGRANAMQEYETLNVPNVKLISKPCFLGRRRTFWLTLANSGTCHGFRAPDQWPRCN